MSELNKKRSPYAVTKFVPAKMFKKESVAGCMCIFAILFYSFIKKVATRTVLFFFCPTQCHFSFHG